MASSSGPRTPHDSSLLFYYDIDDVHNSFNGEPTTNLIPSATINALPTYGNGWSSYNTNQYNGGSYFSIGTISSVSSNIVTTASAHPLRTYDVVNPQTTGGGVTASTNYFVKKISSTQFSLHEYNSSQDGSQGYINTATGTFKVHDSIATDTRVSINATSFPTMWWGSPHLPNSGLVKEIIPNGYTVPGKGTKTDCMRHHVFRTDSVADGMAYGVDATFTPNSPVYVSFYMKANTASAVSQGVYFTNYTYNTTAANSYGTTFYLGQVGVWQRYGYTFTSPNSVAISYWFPAGTSTPYSYDLANIQIEQKNHPTAFTTSSRTSTQSLYSLTNNYVVSLNTSTFSFDSNGKPYFDGTNDYLTIGTGSNFFPMLNFTLESVVKTSGLGSGMSLNGIWGFTYGIRYAIDSSGNLIFSVFDTIANTSTLALTTSGVNLNNGAYHHIVAVAYSNSIYVYIDGVLRGSDTSGSHTGTNVWTGNEVNIGRDNNDAYYYFNGQIGIAKLFNRGLSFGEIMDSYSQYKTRFNLS